MFGKINVLGIVRDHILTLTDNRTGKVYYPDILGFFIFPLLISILLIFLDFPLNDGIVNALITSFSIFAALLFNLLLLVYDIAGKLEDSARATNGVNKTELDKARIADRLSALREVYINISFCILISSITVVILLTYFFKPNTCKIFDFDICLLQWIRVLVTYYLSIQFILSLFMILKRIYKLLSRSFNNFQP